MEIIIKIEDEKLENSNKTRLSNTENNGSYSQYARFFDEKCPEWNEDSEYNLMFLKQQQMYFTGKLMSKGYLFLNEVYEALGIPKTKAGQIVGWVYDKENPIGDNYVDFGLTDERSRAFVNGYENSILLDFNVDGNIFDRLN